MMKAMAMGAIPLTSRWENSTLPELVRGWDLGPPGQESLDAEWVGRYVDAVVDAVGREERGELRAWREGMVGDARERFDWRAVARIWDTTFNPA